MPRIKSMQAIAEKWAEVTPQRSGDYEAGIKDPSVDWASATAAAEESYVQGVQEAATNNRFSKGVQAAGNQKWRDKAVTLGVARWGQGVRAAKGAYQTGFEPYRQVIEATSLPPRFSRGDPRNIDRVAALAEALHQRKVQGS